MLWVHVFGLRGLDSMIYLFTLTIKDISTPVFEQPPSSMFQGWRDTVTTLWPHAPDMCLWSRGADSAHNNNMRNCVRNRRRASAGGSVSSKRIGRQEKHATWSARRSNPLIWQPEGGREAGERAEGGRHEGLLGWGWNTWTCFYN